MHQVYLTTSELTPHDTSIRSHVEHAIGHLKQWKTIATGYRGRLTELPESIATITRLELFRLGW